MNKPAGLPTPRTDALIGELVIEAGSFKTMYYEALDYWNTMSEHARLLETQLARAVEYGNHLSTCPLGIPFIRLRGGNLAAQSSMFGRELIDQECTCGWQSFKQEIESPVTKCACGFCLDCLKRERSKP